MFFVNGRFDPTLWSAIPFSSVDIDVFDGEGRLLFSKGFQIFFVLREVIIPAQSTRSTTMRLPTESIHLNL